MRLLADWDTCIGEIRSIDQLNNFLRPLKFETFAAASTNRAIILVNISSIGSEAIILYNTEPQIITLHASQDDVMDLSVQLRQMVQGGEAAALINQAVCQILRRLWDLIVSPIATHLRETLQLPSMSRVWWCSASAAWSLPLHAAGPYKLGQRNFNDLFVSSYTPSVSALHRSTQQPSAPRQSASKHLVVAQASAPGEPALPNTIREAEHITSMLPDATLVSEADGTRAMVLGQIGHHSSVHFACHGHQDAKEPFNSHFSLYDGPLRLVDILEKQFPQAEMAFLAACHSAEGDRRTPDEGIHLVAGMQFAGFRSVVGTLWACEDEDGPKLAEAFYRYLLKMGGGRIDFSRTAEALAHATKALRRTKVPLGRWIQYVHFGL